MIEEFGGPVLPCTNPDRKLGVEAEVTETPAFDLDFDFPDGRQAHPLSRATRRAFHNRASSPPFSSLPLFYCTIAQPFTPNILPRRGIKAPLNRFYLRPNYKLSTIQVSIMEDPIAPVSPKRPREDDDEPSFSTPVKAMNSAASSPLSVVSNIRTPSPLKSTTPSSIAPSASLSQAAPASSSSTPQPAKRRKLTQKEKDDQRLEKEAKAKARADKKSQKDAEDKLKAEQKAQKEQEKRKKAEQRDEKKRQKEEKQQLKEEEKAKKERVRLFSYSPMYSSMFYVAFHV